MIRTRVRTRTFPQLEGQVRYQSTVWPQTKSSGHERCEDVTGNKGGVNAFIHTRERRSGGLVNGDKGGFYFINAPATMPGAGILSTPAITQANYGNRMLAQSGPMTPRLYLPVALFELRDIPKMLKHAGDLLHKIGGRSGLDPAKEAAAATLAYQFGWAPLIQDIGKMLDFSDAVRKRQLMLQRAHSKKGVRRRVMLDRNTETREGQRATWSTYSLSVNQKYRDTLSYKRWATVTWTVKDQSQIGRIPTYNEAMRTTLGLNKGHIPIALWKAMPWTWAIDWFTDISNVLQANYNMIYYSPSRGCIMTEHKSERYYRSWRAGRVEVSSAVVQNLSQLRLPFNPTSSPTMKLPFLDSFKLSIVGSMSILAMSRR